MAAASPTPLASYSNGGRISRQSSMHSSLHQSRRESPMSLLGQSHGFTANAPMMQRIDIGDSSDEDEIEAPMKLNPYTRALLGQDGPSSPDRQARGPPKLRISRNSLGHTSDTPMQDSITPAPSLRIKRVPLRGAPMRRLRRTPQGDDDQQQPSIIDDNMSMQQAGSPHARSPPRAGSPRIVRITSPSQDQENINAAHAKAESVMRVNSSSSKVDSMMKDASLKDSVMKSDRSSRPSSNHDHKPAPLAPVSVNTPLRPAPPPPPKMSVLETATSAAGASTVKQKKRRRAFMVNGKPYQEIGRIGKGGSSDVYRVMAENGKLFALKRVKLEDADENAVRGYKGEIDLLRKLEGVERVVRLFDWEVDEEKQILSVVSEVSMFPRQRQLMCRSSWTLVNPTWPGYCA